MTALPRNVAYLGPYPPIRGGISQHGYQLVKAIEDLGVVVEVISWRDQYPRLLYPGSQHGVSSQEATHILKWWSPMSWLTARRAIRWADVVVVPYVSPIDALPWRVILGGATGTRVALVHNAVPHELLPMSRIGLRLVLTAVDRVTTHSQAVANQIKAISPGVEVTVVPHPPNLEVEPAPMPEGKPRGLFFGYIRSYKGVDLLIDAVAELRSSGTDLPVTIAGEPWQDPKPLIRQAREKGVEDLIDFRFGYLPNEIVGKLLAQHHLVIQPYRSASQSGVVPLAFAAGRGVVVTPVGGLSETVRDGINGFVASSVSSHAVAEAIAKGLDNVVRLSSGAIESTTSWAAVAGIILGARELPDEAGRGPSSEKSPAG